MAWPTAPDGPIYVPGTLPGETVEVEAVPGQPDRRHLLNVETPERRTHRADLSAFRRLRRLRLAALAERALPRVEARSRRRGVAPGRHRSAGRRSDRRPWRGPPPRRLPCPAQQPTTCSTVGFSAARAHQLIAIDRCPVLAKSLDGALRRPGPSPRARTRQEAARHPRDGDRCGPRYRRARLGPADGAADGGAGARRRAAQTWRG